MRQLRMLCLASALFLCISVHAQGPKTTVPKRKPPAPAAPGKPAPTVPPSGAHALEPADLEAFFDGIIPLQLERSDVAGATVLVMKDGQTLLQKGYGYSDLSKKTPVDPANSIFRLASISKLFTWISVMQLVEQGRLNLDTDVNQYLDFQIAPAFGKPITLRNLMTHTGGFEEVLRDLIVVDPKQSPSLRDFLIQNQPRRLFPPGEVSAYSNYGVGLAGYIVQRVSGEPYEDYVAQHIFTPLGMTHSSFRQPLPENLASLASNGYKTSTEKPPIGFEIINPAPAGGLSTTASDMGRFAQALLNGGELDGQRILKPETLQAMWTRQYAASDQLPAMCMGFYQVWRNGLHFIGHEGDLVAFHSLFFLEPEQKLVLFVSYNSAGSASRTRDEVLRAFADRYYPYQPKPAVEKPSADELSAIVGTYESTRRSDSTKMRLGVLMFNEHASVDPKDGLLRIDDFKDLRDHVQKYELVGKDLWQEKDGQDHIFGIRDGSGKVTRLAFDFPGQQLQRTPWYDNDRLILSLLGASFAVLALVVLASLLRLGRRIFFPSRPRFERQPATVWLTFGPRMAAFAWIILGAVVGATVASMVGANSLPPSHAADKYFMIFNVLTVIAIFFSLFAIRAAAKIVQQREVRGISRLKFSLVALACAFLIWFSIHWNLIGPARRF
jgi:CubicO group peptidase (beta-lactamase class C family)